MKWVLLSAVLSNPITMTAWALLSSLLCASTFAADPSGGWLSYARYKAPKPTDVITKLSATMVVSAAVRR